MATTPPGTTTSNQDHGVTTTESAHVAKTDGPTDVNYNPPVAAPVPHPNEVETKKATEHTTAKTTFGGGQVVREGDAIGPNSGPAHPDNGAGGGTGSGTHLLEARVPTGSPNVTAENKPIAREGDKTTNNHVNTKGQVTGPSPVAVVPPNEEDKKKACTIDWAKIKCTGGNAISDAAHAKATQEGAGPALEDPPDHNREAGPDHVLEVVSPDTVQLTSERKNAKEASKGPECELGKKHTQWLVSKWQKGEKLKEQEFNGNNHTLDPEWFRWPGMPGIVANEGGTGSKDKPIDQNTDRAKQAVRDARQQTTDSKGTIRNVPNPHASSQSGNAGARETYANMQNAANKRRSNIAGGLDAVQGVAAAAADIVQFLKIWNAYSNPVEVKIEAFACSGAEKYTIRSVPGGNAEFVLGGELLEKVKAVCAILEKFCKIFQKLSSLAGLPARSGLKLCEGAEVELECEWKEMDKDVPAIKKYKHHVDLSWEITFRFAKLIEFNLDFGIPLAYFLNLFAPGSGNALNTLMNTFGLEATVGVDIDFCLTPALWASKDEGATKCEWGGGVQVKLELYFRLKVRWGDWLEVSGGAVLDFDIKGGAFVEGLDLWNFEVKMKGEVKVGFKGAYRIDLWWWSKADTFTYFPEQAKLSLKEFGFKPLALLKG